MLVPSLALIKDVPELVEADVLVAVNVRLLHHLQYLLVREVEPDAVEDELNLRRGHVAISVLIEDSEDLLQIVNSFLLCLSLDHQLHKLPEVHRARSVSISILNIECLEQMSTIVTDVNQLLQLLRGGVVTQGPHDGPQFLGSHQTRNDEK